MNPLLSLNLITLMLVAVKKPWYVRLESHRRTFFVKVDELGGPNAVYVKKFETAGEANAAGEL